MKPITVLAALLLAATGVVPASNEKFLNEAILTLPARYVADVPKANRGLLLQKLNSGPYENKRMDAGHGWIHWYSDAMRAESPGATSMFWVKLLPVPDGSPLVLVHMAKPFAHGATPAKNQTFVLQRVRGDWKDVTRRVMPREVDLTMHFRPRRSAHVIEAAPFEKFERQDGGGSAWRFGKRQLDLIWKNGAFQVRPAASPKLSGDDLD